MLKAASIDKIYKLTKHIDNIYKANLGTPNYKIRYA